MTDPADDRRSLQGRERLLATLSHEIRTPLNGVLGMAGLLADTRLDPTQAAYLQTLRDCGEHLLSLVNDVLDYAKLDAQPVRLDAAPVDVEALLQGVCELLSPRAHAAGIEVAWATRGAVPLLMADDGRLRQILFNLAGNAVKMTKEGGVLLTAEAVSRGDERLRLRLSVADTGPGVAAEHQAGIFDEFVQTEDGEAAGGAGLGLAIVRRLAEAFGGVVGVRSAPDQGAEFWFEADFALAAHSAKIPADLSQVRVAVISPSATVRDAACAQIKTSGGIAVAAAAPDASLSDVQLILVDGALTRDDEPFAIPTGAPSGVPTLILLAPEERRRIPAARAAGYAGYLIKPLRRASIVDRAAELLGLCGAAPAIASADDERAAAPPAAIGARVLLAEDNPVNALLARTLLTQAGCHVDRAATGTEALAAATTAPYDLILTDLRMPGLDGLSLARRLRADGIKTPIVALTANAFDEDRRACLEAGMDDFLAKPLDPAGLQTMLMRWASGPAAAPRPSLAATA